jgi:tRNA threonylcarbamoyladenosine biosynthesis protein TsaE
LDYPYEVICRSKQDTIVLAEKFAKTLRGNEVVVLNGTLGSGKTFFIKSVCAEFGIDNVVSPTFAIVNEHDGKFHINHFDFYRIIKSSELLEIGFDDYLNHNNSITFIEWGDLFTELLPKKRIKITIEFIDDNSRKFLFQKL